MAPESGSDTQLVADVQERSTSEGTIDRKVRPRLSNCDEPGYGPMYEPVCNEMASIRESPRCNVRLVTVPCGGLSQCEAAGKEGN